MKKTIFNFFVLLFLIFTGSTIAHGSANLNYISISDDSLENIRDIAVDKNVIERLNSKVYLDDPLGTVFSGVGVVINGNCTLTSLPSNNCVRGTGFVIDDYTFLTNTHVADNITATKRFQKPDISKLKFFPSVQNGKAPYSFNATDVTFISNTDIAIVHTNKKMTNSNIRTMKLANEQEIANFKNTNNKGQRIHLASYISNSKGILDKMYWSQGIFLSSSKNIAFPDSTVSTLVALTSNKTDGGSSGGPIMNKDYKVIGVHAVAWNYPDNKDLDALQLTGGGMIEGYIRDVILRHTK